MSIDPTAALRSAGAPAPSRRREGARRLLVAGNDQRALWSTNALHRNPCSGQFVPTNPPTGQLVAVAGTAIATSAARFMPGTTWQNLISGDSSRQFQVEDVTYRYEDRTAGSVRADYNSTTVNANIPTHTVRNAALQGGTRTLLRVTIQGRVVRNGQTSQARVTREFEVVPKCCKRSFGRHSGLGVGESDPAWGTDPVLECPMVLDDGIGRGIIGSLNGGGPSGSNNTLDIVDEQNNLITRALCWGGNLTANSDLTGTPNPACLNGTQALGKASKSKPGITFVPTGFDLELPRPRFGDAPGAGSGPDGGWIANLFYLQSYPGPSFGNWAPTLLGTYWLRTFSGWKLFATKGATSVPSFAGCNDLSDIALWPQRTSTHLRLPPVSQGQHPGIQPMGHGLPAAHTHDLRRHLHLSRSGRSEDEAQERIDGDHDGQLHRHQRSRRSLRRGGLPLPRYHLRQPDADDRYQLRNDQFPLRQRLLHRAVHGRKWQDHDPAGALQPQWLCGGQLQHRGDLECVSAQVQSGGRSGG